MIADDLNEWMARHAVRLMGRTPALRHAVQTAVDLYLPKLRDARKCIMDFGLLHDFTEDWLERGISLDETLAMSRLPFPAYWIEYSGVQGTASPDMGFLFWRHVPDRADLWTAQLFGMDSQRRNSWTIFRFTNDREEAVRQCRGLYVDENAPGSFFLMPNKEMSTMLNDPRITPDARQSLIDMMAEPEALSFARRSAYVAVISLLIVGQGLTTVEHVAGTPVPPRRDPRHPVLRGFEHTVLRLRRGSVALIRELLQAHTAYHKREHDVRGHWRTLHRGIPSERKVWVSEHKRGDPALGTVSHNVEVVTEA